MFYTIERREKKAKVGTKSSLKGGLVSANKKWFQWAV